MTLCPSCNVNPRRKPGTLCTVCHSAREKTRRLNDVAIGKLCARCKIAPRKSNAYCAACSTFVTTEYKYRQTVVGRLCTKCGVNKCNTSGTVCNACATLQRRATPERQALWRAKKQAKALGWEFNLELADIVIPTHCPVFGMPLVLSDNHVKDDSPSLDRIDATKGYVKGNVWVISQRANRIKNDSTLIELKLLILALEKHATTENR